MHILKLNKSNIKIRGATRRKAIQVIRQTKLFYKQKIPEPRSPRKVLLPKKS